MAKPYLENLQQLVDQLTPQITLLYDIECEHFFSGAAAYTDGQIFMSLSPVGLALKLPEDAVKLLIDLGGKPLRYFPKSPVKKGYAVLPQQIVDDNKGLGEWISQSIEFANNTVVLSAGRSPNSNG